MKTEFLRYALKWTFVAILFIFLSPFIAVKATAIYTPSTIFPGPLANLDDTVYVQLSNCGDRAEVCMDIPVSGINNYQIFEDGLTYASGIAGCDYDTTRFYIYNDLHGQGTAGNYQLSNWTINSSSFSAPFNTIDELVDSMNIWDPMGNWANNNTLKRIVGGNPENSYSDIEIWVQATLSFDTLERGDILEAKGTALNFGLGTNQIILIEDGTFIRDTFVVITNCVISEVLRESIDLDESGIYCLDFSELPGTLDQVWNDCPDASGSAVDFQLVNGDSCVQFVGLSAGVDTACIIACDENAICDTTTLIYEIESAIGYTEVYDTIVPGQVKFRCINRNIFVGTPGKFINDCEGLIGHYTDVELNDDSHCIIYTGEVAGGTSEACIILCDDLANCDTTQLYITVRREGALMESDSLFLNQSGQFCDLDTTNLNAPLDSVYNACEMASGEFVLFELDTMTWCFTYSGIDAGVDSACWVLVDTLGNMDTTIFIVESMLPQAAIETDIIRLGLDVSYCLDTTQLGGVLQDSIFSCGDNTSDFFNIELDSDSYCVNVEAIAAGIDTFCWVICDEFQVCDTTTYILTTESIVVGLPPIVTNDLDTTFLDVPIELNVTDNDNIPDGGIDNFFILPESNGGTGPDNGAAFVASDSTIQYVPNPGFCGSVDSFSYVICNPVACDTAEVIIYVTCPPSELSFYSGFSPNGDSVNDEYVIEGVENFEGSVLRIFNRWGLLVFQAEDYRNDWRGQWDGNDLPDGVYFYLFEDGQGNTYHGDIMLQR
ncbi:MAG: gliding motility-associated C-terminal domain-containing protein [Bacteroidota bacterium]